MYGHCRNTEEEMRSLRRCGCSSCYHRYRELEDGYNRSRAYRDYQIPNLTVPLSIGVDAAKEEKKMTTVVEEPKNCAVKTLVDKLKTEQSTLASQNSSIESNKKLVKTYSDYVKDHKKKKADTETKIKELGAALKKLGHKE